MKKSIKIMMISAVSTVLPLLASATLIADPIDNNDGWINIGGGFYSTGIGGLTPVAGDNFWTASGSTSTRGAWKLFSDTFAAEQLKVFYSVGDRNDSTAIEPGTFLFADTNNDNTYQWTERILAATTSRPSPADGWADWTDTYTISASTATEGGELVLGKKIGFFFTKQMEGASSAYAMDALTIQTIPEPATLGLIVMTGAGLISVRRFMVL